MTEQRTSVIEEGDHIYNSRGYEAVVLNVQKGRYGLATTIHFIDSNVAHSFKPYELAPIDRVYNWYGWVSRGYVTLANGVRIGSVDFDFLDPRNEDIKEYDAEWERTIDTMRSEEMQSRPTTIRMG